MSHFVTTDWLAAHIEDPSVTIVDGTWHLPTANRDARAEYEAGHIPGAIRFDVDAVADTRSGLPHMLPSEQDFSRMAGELGIGSEHTIVVYDEQGLFSAPRVWWTLRVMGARDVRILEGGGPKWRSEGRPLESGASKAAPAQFKATLDHAAIAALATVREASKSGSQILDARPAARFAGTAPEPRPGLRAGHIPGSTNVPFPELVENGKLKSADQLRAIFDERGIDTDQPIITSCGSGVTAAMLVLALDIIGASRVMLYDGAWAEWGGRDDTPVARD